MINYYKQGTWNIVCYVCGKKYKADEVKRRWDDVYVCKKDYERRHDQELLRVEPEHNNVSFVRAYPLNDTFINYTCSMDESYARANIATADCARISWMGYSDVMPILNPNRAIAGLAIAGLVTSGV